MAVSYIPDYKYDLAHYLRQGLHVIVPKKTAAILRITDARGVYWISEIEVKVKFLPNGNAKLSVKI